MIRAMAKLSVLVVSAGLACATTAARADNSIKIDLNKLEPREAACRAYFVLENLTESSFSGFTLDLYVFDPDGVIQKRLVVDTAPVNPDKTRIRPVDIRDMACEQISKVVVNDVIDCRDASGEREGCVDQLELLNHTSATFSK